MNTIYTQPYLICKKCKQALITVLIIYTKVLNKFRPTVLRMKELCKATVAISKALCTVNGLNMFEVQIQSARILILHQMPSGGCS